VRTDYSTDYDECGINKRRVLTKKRGEREKERDQEETGAFKGRDIENLRKRDKTLHEGVKGGEERAKTYGSLRQTTLSIRIQFYKEYH